MPNDLVYPNFGPCQPLMWSITVIKILITAIAMITTEIRGIYEKACSKLRSNTGENAFIFESLEISRGEDKSFWPKISIYRYRMIVSGRRDARGVPTCF